MTQVVRWPGSGPLPGGGALAGLLAAYHLRTEQEKGRPVAGARDLPEHYRIEVDDPAAALAGTEVLLATREDAVVGCLVVTPPEGGSCEVKRLWTDPAHRGQGVASTLVRTAVEGAAANGVGTVRLSVWGWREDAIALYERFGFTVAESWDDRADMVCMELKLPSDGGAGLG